MSDAPSNGPGPPRRARRLSDWWLFGGRGVIMGAQAVVLLSFSAVMPIGEFGRFAFAFAAARMVMAAISFGMPNYLLRELPSRQARGQGGVPAGRAAVLCLVLPAATRA